MSGWSLSEPPEYRKIGGTSKAVGASHLRVAGFFLKSSPPLEGGHKAYVFKKMKIKKFVVGYIMALAIFLFAQRHTEAVPSAALHAVIDLTHTVGENNPAYENSAKPLFEAKTSATIEKDGYFSREISLPEHFGTHIDAPAHFAP